MNSIITIKMGSNFESIKHFYQNVSQYSFNLNLSLRKGRLVKSSLKYEQTGSYVLIRCDSFYSSCASRQF
jgi:hypothetical protein